MPEKDSQPEGLITKQKKILGSLDSLEKHHWKTKNQYWIINKH